MITSTRSLKRAAAGATAGLLVFSGLAVGATSASADETFTLERLSGPDRYATAAAIANETFPDGSDTVLIGGGGTRNYPDSLAGNYLAGSLDAPLLLTAADQVPDATFDGLTALGAEEIVILGGFAAVSAEVEAELEDADYSVTRVSGADRYKTASRVAERPDETTIGEAEGMGRTAILANGQNFPDALAAGPLSFAANLPITITRPGALPEETEATLENLEIEYVLVVGGDTAVSPAVVAEVEAMGIETKRLSGPTRQRTAVEIADYAKDELGFSDSHVDLARGDDFADALTGGPHSGSLAAPILLTDTASALGAATREFLEDNCPTLTEGHIFGGDRAITEEVRSDAVEAASSCETTEPEPEPEPGPATPTATIDIAPTDEATATATINVADTTTVDDRTFTLDGLFAGETYRITLVTCENVQGSGRDATFLAEADATSSTGFAAATGDPTADITSVNGVDQGDSDTATVGIERGTTTFVATGTGANFTIDGDSPGECVVPVVYFDAMTANANAGGDINRLEVQAPATAGGFTAPVEDFNVGGRTNFVAGLPVVPVDSDSATVTAVSAFDSADDADNDTLTVSFDEAVQGVGTFLLRDEAGNIVAEFEVVDGAGTDELTLEAVTGSFGVDFDEDDAMKFVLEILNERDLAGNQTNGTEPVDETGTEAKPVVTVDSDGPVITDAVVATDSATATDSTMAADSAEATGTASAGDFFELTLGEALATDTVDGATLTLEDGDGNSFVVECGATPDVPLLLPDDITAATCTLSNGGLTLTIELLEDVEGDPAFPLVIRATTGFADEAGNEVDLSEGDIVINVDVDTAESSSDGLPLPLV